MGVRASGDGGIVIGVAHWTAGGGFSRSGSLSRTHVRGWLAERDNKMQGSIHSSPRQGNGLTALGYPRHLEMAANRAANRAPRASKHSSTSRRAGHDRPIMKVLVHVKDKCIPVSVGDGDQPVRWLANVGIARHDDNQGRMLGLPVGVKAEDGSMLNMDSTLIAAQISDMQHVWIHFKGA